MALAIPESIREVMGDKASLDLIEWANKSFEHNLDLRIRLTEQNFKVDLAKLKNEIYAKIDSKIDSLTWKFLGFISGILATQTALIMGFIYFIHK